GKKARDGLDRFMPADKEPYTVLRFEKNRFFGGPAAYRPQGKDPELKKYLDEYVKGQDFDKILAPGEELTTFVCTDPSDPDLMPAVNKYKGDLLWRVHVRRGTVTVEGRRIPCTAVIGVKFSTADI